MGRDSIEQAVARAILGRVEVLDPLGRTVRFSDHVTMEGSALAPAREVIRDALVRALTAQAWTAMVVWAEFFRLNFPDVVLDWGHQKPANESMYQAPADLAAELMGE